MKKKLLMLFSLLLCCALSSCDFDSSNISGIQEVTKLPTPNIREVLDNYVYWDEVPNASSYVIKINSYQENAGNQLKYSISSIMDNRIESNVPTELHIYVKANGNQILYSDSDWSSEYVYTYTKTKSDITGADVLDFPKNIDFKENIITWDVVENASYYQVEITENEEERIYNRSSNYYEVSFNNSTSFSYRVRSAKEVKASIVYSSWSALQTGEYIKTTSKETFNQSHLEKGLGKTVDLVNGAYNEVMIGGTSIFDEEKLSNLYVSTNSIRLGHQVTYTGDSIEKYIDDYTSNVSVKFSISKIKPGQKKLVSQKSLGLDLSYDNEYKTRSESETNYYFYTFENSWEDEEIYFDAYKNSAILSNALSNQFIDEAKALQSNTNDKNIKNFINKYGTHLITDAIFGAKLSVSYSLIGTKTSVEEKSKHDVKADLGISKSYWETNVDVGVTIDSSKYSSSSNVVSNLSVDFIGGKNVGFVFDKNDLSSFSSSYKTWAESTNEKINDVLIDVRDKSLYCIWDLLDDNEFRSLKNSLDEYFDKNASESYDEYASKLNKFIDNNQSVDSYYLETTLLSCGVDNGYNYDKPDTNANNSHYSYDYDFGKFIVKNVSNREEDYFLLDKSTDASVLFKVTYDCDNLPLQDNMTMRYVEDDSYSVGFYNMPGGDIGNRTPHKGMIVTNITYEDGSIAVRTIDVDVFNGKKAGDEILIISGINKSCKIDIAICVEFGMWAPGFLGISGQYWMNYRINQVINFK